MIRTDTPGHPNIVFFMVDQLSAKWLEAARNGVCPTPNLDRLAGRGTTFTHAISSNPVCCPTRATIATGLTTRGHGVLENGYDLDPNLPTFMQALQKAGWRTGALGKVHFRAHFAGLWPDCHPYGFDVTHMTEDSRGGEWLEWVEQNHPEHFEAVLATIWSVEISDFEHHGAKKENLRKRIKAIRSRYQWATPEFPKNTAEVYPLPFPEEVSQTAWITNHALEFLRQTPAEQPLYAHISYVQPHDPSCPPADYLDRVNTTAIPAPVPAEWTQDPNAPGYFKDKHPEQGDWKYKRHLYFADICHLDHQLGRILDALEESGRLDNTYIFFLADHGELLFDHGFCGKEERHYDACIRVPLIISGPGVKCGATCEQIVQLEDICPTVLDMTAQSLPPMPKMGPYLPIPQEEIPILPGRSLLPLCKGEVPSDWRDAAYCESYNVICSYDPTNWARTIRTKQFRYTFYPCGGGEQMFDLRKDPDEQHNRVADPNYADIRRELRDRLMELIVMQDYPKTRRNLFALGVH
ncbi:MAG: sulfatase-like hydrolase/transferase [Actinobacteria bacterium]|nr:sulfatase-like hydrolase/transferase [Actinomycetota bacterium]